MLADKKRTSEQALLPEENTASKKRTMLDSRHLDTFVAENPGIEPQMVSIEADKFLKFERNVCKDVFESRGCDMDRPGRKSIGSHCARTKLCADETCQPCFNRSLASSARAAFFVSSNSGKSPRQLAKGTHEMCAWQCNKCPHQFFVTPHAVTSKVPTWCPYCAGKRLCDLGDSCSFCFSRSLAASPHAPYFVSHPKGLSIHLVAMSCNFKCTWKCPVCKHDFERAPSGLQRPSRLQSFCPYCAIPSKLLCANDDCRFCFERSLASSSHALEFVSHPDKLLPRHIRKSTHVECTWRCSKCQHLIKKAGKTVESGSWCKYCSTKALCGDPACESCGRRSIANSPLLDMFLDGDNDESPYLVPLFSSEKKYWWCSTCKHRFHKVVANLHMNLHPSRTSSSCSYCIGHICGDKACATCAPRCEMCESIKKSHYQLLNGTRVCRDHFVASGECPTRKVRLEILFLAEMQRFANEQRKYEFYEPTSWSCAILPGLAFKPDMLWAFDEFGNVFSFAGPCKLNTGAIKHIIILEVLEVGIEQHSASSWISDEERERQIRTSLVGLTVDFVYVVIAAYNHQAAAAADKFFTLNAFTYSIPPSRKQAWADRIQATLEALAEARIRKKGATIFIGGTAK